ncbi:MAG: phosphate/phosphite/phosphonate ABC transporter substrate-binding protein [Firmicutes bacterium]|nr:phosphate/phosphite/phosphonate ABC transporter substrate-binding protein [Bacillota bacterium]
MPGTDMILAIVITATIVIALFVARDLFSKKKMIRKGSTDDLLGISERISFDAQQLIWLINAYNLQIATLVNIVDNVAISSEGNAAKTEEVSAGIQQLSSLSRDISKRTGRIKTVYEDILAGSLENRGWIDKSGKTLLDISETIKESAKAMDGLENVVGKVNDLLGNIQNVTEEINLLALNASIEAARAGEYGLGFTVVADEVKKLSDKTDKMTQEVQYTITEVNNQLRITGATIDTGVEKISVVENISRRSVQSFDKTVQQLQEVKDFIWELATNTEDQVEVSQNSAGAIQSISDDSTEVSDNIYDMSKIFGEQRKDSEKILDCSKNLNKVGYDLHRTSVLQKKRNMLIFGVNPFTVPENIREQYLPIIDEIGRLVGRKTRTVIVPDYEALTNYIKDGLIDLGWFSPKAYVNAKKEVNLRPLVTPIKNGSAFYKGQIITSKDTDYYKLSDLRGSSFCFVDPLSTSGYIYPLHLLKNEGLNIKKDFKSIAFLGNHDNVINAVIDKRVDAGATFTEAIKMAGKAGVRVDQLRVIAETEPIPNDAISANPNLSLLLSRKIKKEFLSINRNENVKEVMKEAGIDGFQEALDSSYDVVRKQQ